MRKGVNLIELRKVKIDWRFVVIQKVEKATEFPKNQTLLKAPGFIKTFYKKSSVIYIHQFWLSERAGLSPKYSYPVTFSFGNAIPYETITTLTHLLFLEQRGKASWKVSL